MGVLKVLMFIYTFLIFFATLLQECFFIFIPF